MSSDLIICIIFISENCKKDRCIHNGILKKENFIQSESGISKFVLNKTGNLEIWCASEMIWSINTYDNYIDFLYFGNNGIYPLGKDGSIRMNGTLNSFKRKADLLLMQNDGNLVIYDECGGRIWHSMTDRKCFRNSGK